MITYEQVKQDPAIRTYIQKADESLRVLGFTQRGQLVLREMKGRAALPILTKPAHAHHLDETGRRLFELEARCTDLYDLCLETVPTPGREWTTDPINLES